VPNPFESLYRIERAAQSGGGRVVSDFDEEYRAAMEGAVAFDRTHRASIRVTGRDRESFLQNMLTNDVRALPVFKGVLAAFLTSKGKLVSDMIAVKMEEAFLLECERERVEPLRKALDRYVISEDVVLEGRAERDASFSVEGPAAAAILARLTGHELEALEHLQTEVVQIDDVSALVTAHRREPTPRYDVRADASRAAGILEKVLDEGALLGGELVAECRRIEAGRPRFGVDVDETHIPQEAGLEDALSFSKGCYIGQEVVVRLAHRGHVNRKLVGLRVEGDAGARPAPGAKVLAKDADVGAVTSSTMSPSFGCPLALAYLKRDFFASGTRVALEGGAEAVVSALPFERPDSGSV
jgi:folate-binding protein YgfZ